MLLQSRMTFRESPEEWSGDSEGEERVGERVHGENRVPVPQSQLPRQSKNHRDEGQRCSSAR